MIDKFLKNWGVGFALLFLVVELSYINTISLIYMYGNQYSRSNFVFGVIGAIAFSIVTVLIMRLSKRDWLKLAFPIFDFALAFLGFNLKHADNLMDNPIRFALSIFLAAFAAFITYSLGQINAEQHPELPAGELELLKTNLNQFESKWKVSLENEKLLRTEIDGLNSNLNEIESNLQVTVTKNEQYQKLLKHAEAKAETYYKGYLANERSRILKKSEKNRTEEELKILELAIS